MRLLSLNEDEEMMDWLAMAESSLRDGYYYDYNEHDKIIVEDPWITARRRILEEDEGLYDEC